MKKMLPLGFRCAHALLFLAGVPCCLAAAATSDPVADESLVFAEVNGLVAFETEQIHVILEVTDNGTPALTAYQRIICEIH